MSTLSSVEQIMRLLLKYTACSVTSFVAVENLQADYNKFTNS